MPYKISKVKGGYRVKSPSAVHAKKTSKKNAVAQQRLLNMKEAGVVPEGGWRKQ